MIHWVNCAFKHAGAELYSCLKQIKHPSSLHCFNPTVEYKSINTDTSCENVDVRMLMYGLKGCTNTSSLNVCSDVPTMHFQYSDQWDTVAKGYCSIKPKQCVSSHKEGIWGSFLMETVVSDLSNNDRQGSKRPAKALEDWRRVMARKGLFLIIKQIHSLEGAWCEWAPPPPPPPLTSVYMSCQISNVFHFIWGMAWSIIQP